MKSSAPVFTRKNPFQPASRVGKTHYHPSRNQALSKRKRKETTLSPVRSNQRSSPQIQRRSPESHDRCFADEQPVFTESWPSTSPGSTTTSSDVESSKQFERARKATVSSELGGQQDSVLAKYIERFRHGEPQSREERQQMTSAPEDERLPFWWMSSSSLPPSSTPTKATDKDDNHPAVCSPAGQGQRDRSLSPCRGSLSMLSDISQGEFDDTELLQLQERASRLLLKGECALSDGSIPVSSEGVGSSDFSPPVSLDEPVRRPLIPSLLKPATVITRSDPVQAVSSHKFILPPLVTPTRPEEDILFQWRLRRKMEQARERPQSFQHYSLHGATFNLQPPSLSHPSASGLAYKSTQTP
uniref:Proline and serine rich 3 n=1 Tax=Mastacembelus armatus TaxID=205130 RepID=A0A3Q3MLJ2_9TELE